MFLWIVGFPIQAADPHPPEESGGGFAEPAVMRQGRACAGRLPAEVAGDKTGTWGRYNAPLNCGGYPEVACGDADERF